jgi:ZIP family zinc transporter
MLLVDALAPVAGAASTLLVELPPGTLASYLGFFAGFLLYISASYIVPEAHTRAAPRTALVLSMLTFAGAAFAFIAARLAR